MNLAIPYLMFSGNCHEALQFYESCLDGKITSLRTVAEAPFDVPPGMEERIFDSEFKAGSVHFKASDDMPGNEVTVGSNFALFIGSPDADERQRAFEKLSEDGQVLFPLDNNFGMVTDKFNIQWMIARTEE
ncbi:VOC family protein [Candidatus Leptofilum sp.]|uniref:VOC family protein n=1 Tax=Candidatus Leptofilum sp. TaxID=3241576 RepID=UPI003B5BB896